jgi:hypothetical protein
MNTRFFHKRSRFRFAAVVRIAFADEDDELLEAWMIGAGNEDKQRQRPPRSALP